MELRRIWMPSLAMSLAAVLMTGCSLIVPRTLLIDKDAIATEVNKKLPFQVGPLTIGQPLIDFISQRQCIRIELEIGGQILGTKFIVPVSTCSGIRFDQESQSFFLIPESDQIQAPWSGTSEGKPSAGDLSDLARRTLVLWAQKHPIYTIPREKLIRYGYKVSIDKVSIVDEGIFCELH
jgi:hypothetical protein